MPIKLKLHDPASTLPRTISYAGSKPETFKKSFPFPNLTRRAKKINTAYVSFVSCHLYQKINFWEYIPVNQEYLIRLWHFYDFTDFRPIRQETELANKFH